MELLQLYQTELIAHGLFGRFFLFVFFCFAYASSLYFNLVDTKRQKS